MGLCKCPKKKATNQFCYEHRVNVCEQCMIADHPKCVIQSYLLWLQDSDYDPVCLLCNKNLADGDCIRLLCYHVFHLKCIDDYGSNMPPNTAPAGYTCPICKGPIFPDENVISPVADLVKKILADVNWARTGLGLPIIEDKPAIDGAPIVENSMPEANHHHHHPTHKKAASIEPFHPVSMPGPVLPPPPPKKPIAPAHVPQPNHEIYSPQVPNYSAVSTPNIPTTRKIYDARDANMFHRLDHDEDKYRRRSAMEWLSRWMRSYLNTDQKRHRPQHFYKRWVIVGLLAIIALCTIVVIFVRLGRANADGDPLLDPMMNPNIMVHDKFAGRVDKSIEE